MQREVRQRHDASRSITTVRRARICRRTCSTSTRCRCPSVNDLIARLGPTAAMALLSMQANSPQAVAAGITIPYANFTNPAVQTTRSVAQALRPFPQYGTINTTNSGGDKTGRSMYHAAVFKLTQRMTAGFLFQGSYTYLEADDRRRRVQRQHRLDGHGAARARIFHRPARSDAHHQAQHGVRAAVRPRPALAEQRASRATSSADGGSRRSRATAADCRLASRPARRRCAIFNGSNRPNVTGEDWRAPIAGDEFNPRVDRYLNRAAFSAPVAQLGNAPRINGDVRRPWNMTENISVAKTISMTESAAPGRPRGSVQPLRIASSGALRTQYRLQQHELRSDQFDGEFTAADAVWIEAVLVGIRELEDQGLRINICS